MNAFSSYSSQHETGFTYQLPSHLDYLRDINLEKPQFLIKDIIPCNGLIAIVGPSYCYKTFIALDMALSVSAGLPFHGMDTQQGTVIYINGEGRHGIIPRINAWCQSKSIEPQSLPFILSRTPINLRDLSEVSTLKTISENIPDVRLIVIDTLNRNAGGMNENAPIDMAEFVNACSELAHHFNCTVCVIHHTGKDVNGGARGHSSFYAALDTEISVKKLGDHDVQMICSKQKDAPEFETIQFIAVSTLDSVILEKTETRKANAKDKLTRDQELAFKCLRELIEGNTATNGDVAAAKVHLEKWRDEFKRRHSGDNEKSKNTAHQRARKELIALKLVEVKDDFYSLGDKRRQMKNCRPAQIQQRRHDRHMSLDMSSCRRDSGGPYSVSCWNSGLCLPQGFTIIPHLISAVFQFFPTNLLGFFAISFVPKPR